MGMEGCAAGFLLYIVSFILFCCFIIWFYFTNFIFLNYTVGAAGGYYSFSFFGSFFSPRQVLISCHVPLVHFVDHRYLHSGSLFSSYLAHALCALSSLLFAAVQCAGIGCWSPPFPTPKPGHTLPPTVLKHLGYILSVLLCKFRMMIDDSQD